jgi:hypothetical protein
VLLETIDTVLAGDLTTNVTSPIGENAIEGHEASLLANHILHIIGGQVLLPVLLLTMIVGGEARRNPLLVNFCVSWILFSTISNLL